MINGKDREILRQVAYRKASFAHSPENDLIMKKWQALGRSEKTTPTVRLLFSNFTDEVIDKRMKFNRTLVQQNGSDRPFVLPCSR